MSREVPVGWRSVHLSDIASAVIEKWEPGDGDVPFVGLEHVGQGTGTVLEIGSSVGLTSIKTRFKAGDVLFGKLRPNLRKTAHPDFSGVASTDIIALRAASNVDACFLFYSVSAEKCFQHAIASAAGTKMPRTSWPLLSMYPIWLPPLAEQHRIAEILTSVDKTIQATEAVVKQARVLRDAWLKTFFHRGSWEEVKPLPHGWRMELLDQVATRGSGHTPSKAHPEYWDGGVKWVSLQDTKRLDRFFITDTAAEISQLGIENSSAVLHPEGTVILSRDATVGRSAILAEPMAVSQHFIAWQCGTELDNGYLYFWLQHMKPIFERIGAGSTIKTIGLGFFKRLAIPVPPLGEQRHLASRMSQIDGVVMQNVSVLSKLATLKAAVMSDLLRGRKRIATELLMAAE